MKKSWNFWNDFYSFPGLSEILPKNFLRILKNCKRSLDVVLFLQFLSHYYFFVKNIYLCQRDYFFLREHNFDFSKIFFLVKKTVFLSKIFKIVRINLLSYKSRIFLVKLIFFKLQFIQVSSHFLEVYPLFTMLFQAICVRGCD